jgi:protein-L-isoaspartate(D-aspartate) O-methyltransferase
MTGARSACAAEDGSRWLFPVWLCRDRKRERCLAHDGFGSPGGFCDAMTRDFETQRRYLVESLRSAGISDERTLTAIGATPRELFVDAQHRPWAYADQALPIGCGQTISQPLIVATMTQALQLSGKERVLEIGTGSGYQAAILARLAAQVYTVERLPELACQAARRIVQLGLTNVAVYVGDGSLGWPEAAPYDRILVTAAAPQIPGHLLEQLLDGGILVIPVGSHEHQELLVVQRTPSGPQVHSLGGCVFVPLLGKGGWEE